MEDSTPWLHRMCSDVSSLADAMEGSMVVSERVVGARPFRPGPVREAVVAPSCGLAR